MKKFDFFPENKEKITECHWNELTCSGTKCSLEGHWIMPESEF